MYQYFLIFRRNNHISQKLLENYLDKIQEFISYNINWKEKLWIVYNGKHKWESYISKIFIYSTVQTYGSKKVNIWTQEQKWRITVILTILAPWEKLAPLLIFKAKEGKDTERNF